MIAALSGVLTDYNKGSQIRTLMESVGAVVEQQGVGDQTLVLQGIATSALSLFKISPNQAVPSVGTVTFLTSTAQNPPPATQAVQIPAGTLVQTPGGVQFKTTQLAILPVGATSIAVPVQAVKGGSAGNVAAGAITQIISGLTYPLSVTNLAPAAGGIDAQSPSQGLSTLSAKIASLIKGSPVAIANGAIGVVASGSAEQVLYATCYEPWIAAGQGPGSTTAGWSLYVDNGSGAASSALLAAVKAYVDGNVKTGDTGNRPAGVPYQILAVQPVFATVLVAGVLSPLLASSPVSGAISAAVKGYFSALRFGDSAQQAQLAAQVANAALGALTSLSVTLSYTASPNTAVAAVTGLPFNRVILQSLIVNVG